MIDLQREPLEGVVEVDQTEIPFRADNSFFDPVKSGKILIAGAVEVIDRGTNQAKPRRNVNGGGKLGQMPAPELANSAPFSDGGGV